MDTESQREMSFEEGAKYWSYAEPSGGMTRFTGYWKRQARIRL